MLDHRIEALQATYTPWTRCSEPALPYMRSMRFLCTIPPSRRSMFIGIMGYARYLYGLVNCTIRCRLVVPCSALGSLKLSLSSFTVVETDLHSVFRHLGIVLIQ
jgi:hypothetical protein